MTTEQTPAVELCGLTKDYGNKRGLFDASFAMEPGEVVGLLGANGSGKTVTMRLLMGLIRPDDGYASILGLDCFGEREHIQADVGYLPGEITLPPQMRASEFLDYMMKLRGIRGDRRRELEERFELDTDVRIGSMSKGTKQKVAIVSAFMGSPRVLLLDEPTSGLDPIMQERFDGLVDEERSRGAAVLLSSHIFAEVERICDRVAFIRRGHLSPARDIAAMRAERSRTATVLFAGDAGFRTFRARNAGTDWQVTGADPERRSVEIGMTGTMTALIDDLAGLGVLDIQIREASLEDMFFNLYAGTDEPAGTKEVA